MQRAIVLDTETTDLIHNRTLKIDKQPHIIEFYGCLVNLKTGKIKKKVHHLIKPPVEITEEITHITTISNEHVKNSPPFADVADEIIDLIESGEYAIAHNLAFDKEMLDLEVERLKRPPIKWPRLLCTVEQTISLRGYRLNLNDLHRLLFSEPFADAHRANIDGAALTRCCIELVRRNAL